MLFIAHSGTDLPTSFPFPPPTTTFLPRVHLDHNFSQAMHTFFGSPSRGTPVCPGLPPRRTRHRPRSGTGSRLSYPAWLRRGSGGSGPILHATRRCWDDSLRSIDLNFCTRHFLSRTTFSGSCHCSTGCVRTRSIETRPRGHLEFFVGLTPSTNTFSLNKKKKEVRWKQNSSAFCCAVVHAKTAQPFLQWQMWPPNQA